MFAARQFGALGLWTAERSNVNLTTRLPNYSSEDVEGSWETGADVNIQEQVLHIRRNCVEVRSV